MKSYQSVYGGLQVIRRNAELKKAAKVGSAPLGWA